MAYTSSMSSTGGGGLKLERFSGDDEIETFLVVDREHLPTLAAGTAPTGTVRRGGMPGTHPR
jgi:hypothetical protein